MTSGKKQEQIKSAASSRNKPSHDAVIILGSVDDYGSILPGWNYPFTRALQNWTKKLKRRGYKKIGSFREPDSKHLRSILASPDLKAVVFVGHGQYEREHFSFRLNGNFSLSGGDLQDWALNDVVIPRNLSKVTIDRMDDNDSIRDVVRKLSSYNFELTVVHSCHSLRCRDIRSALGGSFEGNITYSFINLPPLFEYTVLTLYVSPEELSKDPVKALQGALMRAIQRLDSAEPYIVPEDYVRRLFSTLSNLIAIRRKGKSYNITMTRIISEVQRGWSIEFRKDEDEYENLTLDEVEAFLNKHRRIHKLGTRDCKIPTKSSNGELGCRRPVRLEWPCWQHVYLL